MRHNPNYISLTNARELFQSWLDEKTVVEQINHPYTLQTEFMLTDERYINVAKILHPIFIKGYRTKMVKHTDKRLSLIGFDIETNHLTGEPRLLGVFNDSEYTFNLSPSYETLYDILKKTNKNGVNHYVCWGALDIQCILRLFNPNENERVKISRGISGRITRKGEMEIPPPVTRKVDENSLYIMHYIPRRALRLGWTENGFFFSRWIFNVSQFYATTLPFAAQGTGLKWKNFARDTHLIDWRRFKRDMAYKKDVFASNEQDARVVVELAYNLLDRFYETFEAYPTLLVSTGSLTDSAVSKLLSDDDYNATAWSWLKYNTYKDTDTNQLDTLLAEAFSAGYVDMHGIGLLGDVWTADISAAYPFQIRKLPDLRESYIVYGEHTLESDLKLHADVETAIIRGIVTIPESLTYHPITIKNGNRVNIRPTGTFNATYTLEERRFCEQYGAQFANENYAIIGLRKRTISPIAAISEILGDMRVTALMGLKAAKTEQEKAVLDGRQYIIKIVDNSIYGKTVMLTESVVLKDDIPVIDGYITGDRYNLLYGTLITARTRTLLASAAMKIKESGGHVVLLMTDSLYWKGEKEMLPPAMIADEKTAGYFEPPEQVKNMFLLKTGLYEYETLAGKWHYKLRGVPIAEKPDGKQSLLHTVIKDTCRHFPANTNPREIIVPIDTRRLVTIGATTLDELGLVKETVTEMKPFILGAKHIPQVVTDWQKCISDWKILLPVHLYLDDIGVHTDAPMAFLRDTYENKIEQRTKGKSERNRQRVRHSHQRKQIYTIQAMKITGKPLPTIDSKAPHRCTWRELENYFGVSHTELGLGVD